MRERKFFIDEIQIEKINQNSFIPETGILHKFSDIKYVDKVEILNYKIKLFKMSHGHEKLWTHKRLNDNRLKR